MRIKSSKAVTYKNCHNILSGLVYCKWSSNGNVLGYHAINLKSISDILLLNFEDAFMYCKQLESNKNAHIHDYKNYPEDVFISCTPEGEIAFKEQFYLDKCDEENSNFQRRFQDKYWIIIGIAAYFLGFFTEYFLEKMK